MKRSQRSTRGRVASPEPQTAAYGSLLTRFAFLLAVALVVGRMMMSETLRAPGDPFPGQDRAPLSPGPATGLILDLLAWVPALLVLARRLFDRTFTLRWSWACIPALLLGLWAIISVAWSADRFAAIVSSFHWLSAMILLWSASQLVTSWRRLRLVAGACAGLLIVLVVSGYYFRVADWPDLKRAWIEQKPQILKEHHWAPDSFDARQFQKNILNGDILGFSTSSNTYGALLVLLGTVTAGIAIEKRNGSDRPTTKVVVIGCLGLILLAALPTLFWARSRGAAATTGLTVACFAALAIGLPRKTRDSHKAYWAAVCSILAGFVALVGHGLYHGTLFHPSLTFRWRYWVGAARLLAAHPIVGVGWENFGPRYLAVRLPIASEEVRDPHNFIVRIFAELGIVGGSLLIAWMLRLWWELTQQDTQAEVVGTDTGSSHPILSLACVGVCSVGINLLASVDFGSSTAYVFLEIMKRGVFLACILAGVALASLRSARDSGKQIAPGQLEFEIEDRPAPWMLYAIVIGLGMFLIHNLIDFAWFESGPMFLFALLAGSALGMRSVVSREGIPECAIAGFSLIGLSAAWVAAAIAVVSPIVGAEALAHDADDAIRAGRPDEAADALKSVFDRVPYNGDYAYRAAMMAQAARKNPKATAELLDAAIADDPSSVNYLRMRAEYARQTLSPDLKGAADDYARARRLDPNNVDLHRKLADVLELLGDRGGSVAQLRAALQLDDRLEPGDPKRLAQTARLQIESQIKSLDQR